VKIVCQAVFGSNHIDQLTEYNIHSHSP